MDENKKAVFNSEKTGESLEVTLEEISPEKAAEYLALNKNNRKKNERSISMYKRDMEKNQWKITGETIKFLKDGTLCDGQNRLNGCIKANVSFISLVVRGISLEAMKAIDAGKTRSVKDYFDFEGIPYSAEITSGAKRYLGLSSGRTNSFSIDGTVSNKLSVSEIYTEYESNKKLYSEAAKFSSFIYKRNKLLTKAMIVAMIRLLVGDKNHSEERVKNFFLQFADEKPACSPVRLLRSKLMIEEKDRSSKYKLSGPARQAYVIKAWNSYVTNKELKQISYNQERDKDLEFI